MSLTLSDFLRKFFYVKIPGSNKEINSVGQALLQIHAWSHSPGFVGVRLKTKPRIADLKGQSPDSLVDLLVDYVQKNFTPADPNYHCEGIIMFYARDKKPFRFRLKLYYYNNTLANKVDWVGFATSGSLGFVPREQEPQSRLEKITNVFREAVVDFYIK